MPDLNALENFEPSLETKSVWRFTRKASAQFAGIVLPGLFQTSHLTLDTATFLIVLGLEAWGLGNLLIVGELSPVYVVFLFLVDIASAIFRHLWQGEVCELQNRLIVADDPDVQARYRSRITRCGLYAQLCSIPIILVAAFKIASFYALQGGQFNGLTAGIVVSYFVAAIIHMNVTGYFLASLLFGMLLWRDRREFLQADTRPAPHQITDWRRAQIVTKIELRSASAHPHKLTAESETSPDQTYVLETWGVLLDSQLHALIQQQRDPQAKTIVARAGVEHQLEILKTDLVTGEPIERGETRRIQAVARSR